LVANASRAFESLIFPCFVSFRFSFFLSFICHDFVFCFISRTSVFISFCFLFVVSFCPAFVPCLYIFYYFRCAFPFILYSSIYCSLCFLWLWYEPWVAKRRVFLRKSPSSLRYHVVICCLGWKGETLYAFWYRYYIFFFFAYVGKGSST
jgi:hypothetical protein